MATRSKIGRINPDGSVTAIYCHWDGYPSHNGVILQDYYTDSKKVDLLLSLGDLSSLGPVIGEQHDFDSCPKDHCNFYGRDRGEKDTAAKEFQDKSAFLESAKGRWVEWVYLFTLDGTWVGKSTFGSEEFLPVEDLE